MKLTLLMMGLKWGGAARNRIHPGKGKPENRLFFQYR
jgi:hypothetical protein